MILYKGNQISVKKRGNRFIGYINGNPRWFAKTEKAAIAGAKKCVREGSLR